MNVPVPVATVGLLLFSNVFMTFAWYGHLRYKGAALPVDLVRGSPVSHASRYPALRVLPGWPKRG